MPEGSARKAAYEQLTAEGALLLLGELTASLRPVLVARRRAPAHQEELSGRFTRHELGNGLIWVKGGLLVVSDTEGGSERLFTLTAVARKRQGTSEARVEGSVMDTGTLKVWISQLQAVADLEARDESLGGGLADELNGERCAFDFGGLAQFLRGALPRKKESAAGEEPVGEPELTDGSLVRMLIGGSSDVDNTDLPGGTMEEREFPAGTVCKVIDVNWYGRSQGWAYLVLSHNEVCVTIDDTDRLPDGRLPWEVLPDDPEHARAWIENSSPAFHSGEPKED